VIRHQATTVTALSICACLICGTLAQAATGPVAAASPAVTVLDGSGVWRVLHSWGPPTGHVEKGFVELQGTKVFDFLTRYPAAGWTEVGFDDSQWARQHFFVKYSKGELDGRTGSGSPSLYLRQLNLRGKFTVTDPAKVKSLWLDAAYLGGIVVHVNGKELKRQHLSAKGLAHGVPADLYPRKAYLKPNGKPWSWFSDADAIAKEGVYEARVRRVEKLIIPPDVLVKGTNVLAVEIHAARYPPEYFNLKGRIPWATCGLVELHLRTDSAEGIVPNVVRPKGLQVWNANLAAEVTAHHWGDPHEALGSIRLAGARNGSYTGKVVVSSDQPIRGLKASIADLTPAAGKGGKLPASALRISYGRFWRVGRSRLRQDALVRTPLAEVPVAKSAPGRRTVRARQADGLPPLRSGAVQCVYVTARIPKDAAPGEYRGTLVLSCQDLQDGKPVRIPVELKVIDWTLPDPADFAYWFGLIQSPEGVGLHYKVPLWSDKHFALIGKSMSLIAQTGGRVLFINLMAETEYGNGHSMVLWDRPQGVPLTGQWWTKCTPDLTRVEKYVALAVKHLGKPRFVVLGVWQPCERRTGPQVSVRDVKTGKIENVRGPKHGSPESRTFWRPVLRGVREIVTNAGLDRRSVLLGYGSDVVPDLKTTRVFWDILPRAGWQVARHSPSGVDHIRCSGGESVAVRYTSNVWGGGNNTDPKVKRVYGWNHTYAVRRGVRTWLDRTTYDYATFARFRCLCEQVLMADRPGLGQIGADFWPPPARKAGAYRLRSLYSRFPHSANVGSGNRGCTTNQLLYPGPDGAEPTVRFELVRENIQECEARIFLERLLILKQMCPLSQDLTAKAQAVLDERTRWHRVNYNFHGRPDAGISWPYSGWEARTAKLYEVAAEVAKAMAKKQNP